MGIRGTQGPLMMVNFFNGCVWSVLGYSLSSPERRCLGDKDAF